MTRAWGMPTSFVHSFIFPPKPWEKLGSYRFPSPSNGSLLTLPTTLFITQVLSAEETLMYFRSTYAPNLTHQGAFVITEISSANGYRNPASSKHLLVHSWAKIASPKGLELYNKHALKIHKARTHVRQSDSVGKAHMHPMPDCGCKKLCTPQNNAFMILVSLSPTSGSSSKSI
jgi:hypothetical protein